jgi:tetratricopeptide (TPR) repeat protein
MSRAEALAFFALDEEDEVAAAVIAAARNDVARGLFRRSIARLDVAIGRGNDAGAFLTKAEILRVLALHGAAIAVLDDALRRAPNDAIAIQVARAEVFNDVERAADGLSAAEAVLALAPEHRRGLYLHGWALGMLGRLDEARASLVRLTELEPNNEGARRAIAMIDHARR